MSGTTKIPRTERVPMLSIHPESARISDVVRLADELMEANQKIWAIKRYAEICNEDEQKCCPLTILEIVWPGRLNKEQI